MLILLTPVQSPAPSIERDLADTSSSGEDADGKSEHGFDLADGQELLQSAAHVVGADVSDAADGTANGLNGEDDEDAGGERDKGDEREDSSGQDGEEEEKAKAKIRDGSADGDQGGCDGSGSVGSDAMVDVDDAPSDEEDACGIDKDEHEDKQRDTEADKADSFVDDDEADKLMHTTDVCPPELTPEAEAEVQLEL